MELWQYQTKEDIILNYYVYNNTASKSIKENLVEPQGNMDKSIF